MKRFTYKHDGNWCISNKNGKLTSDNQGNTWGEAIDCLASFENTELTSENITELLIAKKEGRLIILDKPMLPLIWGDDNQDILLCPNCNHDLMGGFQFAETCETIMFQCPYCGQPIDATKAIPIKK